MFVNRILTFGKSCKSSYAVAKLYSVSIGKHFQVEKSSLDDISCKNSKDASEMIHSSISVVGGSLNIDVRHEQKSSCKRDQSED